MAIPQIGTFDLAEWVTGYSDIIKHNLTNSSIKTPLLSEMGVRVDYDVFQRNRPSLKGTLKRTLGELFRVPEHDILVTCSGSEALFLAIGSTVKAGDEVIVTTPNYAPTYEVPRLIGAQVTFVPSRFEDGFQPDMGKLGELLSKRTKLIVLTNSNNPSGRMIDRKNLEEILELAGDTPVIVDEAFREFGFENAPPVGATVRENCLSLGTMSKFYGVEDLRIGWVIGKREFIEKAKKLKNWTTIENSIFSETMASKVLQQHEEFVRRARRFYQENVRVVEEWIRTRDELEWNKPDCGLISFPKFKIPIGSVELAKRLAEDYHVAIGPGAFFNYEGHFRLCFTRSREEVQEALAALGRGLDDLKGRTI
jgi:aspartate/methionine/tyrosine aminotransferase